MDTVVGHQNLQLCGSKPTVKLAAPKLQAVASPSSTRVLLPPNLHSTPSILERGTQVPLIWRVLEPVPPQKPDPIEMMARIKKTTSWQEMQQLHSSSSADFNNTHTCAAITHLAQLVGRLGPAALRGVHATEAHNLYQERLGSHHSASSSSNSQYTPAVGLRRSKGAWQGGGSPMTAQHSRVHHAALPLGQLHSRPATKEDLQSGQLVMLSDVDAKFLGRLMQQVAANIKQCSMRQVANCLWAIAKVEHATCHTFKASSAWIAAALAAAEHRMASADPQHLASVAYALALCPAWLTYSKASYRLLHNLFAISHSKLDGFKPHELSNLLWAAGTLHKHQLLRGDSRSAVAGCLSAAVELAAVRAAELRSQEICNVFWAVGRLCGSSHKQVGVSQPGSAPGVQHEALLPQPSMTSMACLLQRADALVAEMTPVGLASLILSMGLLGVPQWVQQHTGTAQPLRSEPPPEAAAGSAGWVGTLLCNTESLLLQCGPAELTSLIIGLAYMGIKPGTTWLKSWQNAAFAQLRSFSAQELANSTWALSRLSVPLSKQQLANLLLASAARMPGLAAAGAARLLPALADLGCRPSRAWMELYCSYVYDHLGSMDSKELALVLAALARHRHCPTEAWLQRLTAASAPLLPSMPAHTLALLAHSFAVLGHQPHSSWVAQFMTATKAQLHRCSPRDCSSLLWSVAVLDLQPSSEWVAVCLNQCEALAHGWQHPHEQTEQPAAAWQSRAAQQNVGGVQHRSVVTSGASREAAAQGLWTSSDVAKMQWALARLGYDQDAVLLRQLVQGSSDEQQKHPQLGWPAHEQDSDDSITVLEGMAFWVGLQSQVADHVATDAELVQLQTVAT